MATETKPDEATCAASAASAGSARRPCVIFGTDITKQPDELIESVRNGLSHLRGQLSDIRRAYGWDDRIEQHEGALTVAIASLSIAAEELREFRRRNGDLKWRTNGLISPARQVNCSRRSD